MIFGAIRLGPRDAHGYTAFFNANGVEIGTIEPANDGYFVFWPKLQSGYWDASVLSSLAVCLNSLNREWDAHIQQAFDARLS